MEFCVQSIDQYGGGILITSCFSIYLYITVFPSNFYNIGLACFIKSILTFKIFLYIAFMCQYVHICVCACTYRGPLVKVKATCGSQVFSFLCGCWGSGSDYQA